MPDLGLLSLNISELAQMISSRKVSPLEVTKLAIAHAERMQPLINSFITQTPELALHQAQEMEARLMRGEYIGPLHGIPIGLKDQFRTKGIRSTDGSKYLESYVPNEDDRVVERCKSAGAIILGKENQHEIGAGFVSDNQWYGRVRNPWDPERIAGGSSGGSAANVASFVTYASIGSDGGGSVRMPSAVCGIVGLKPTFGRVSQGTQGGGADTGHIGPHTRSVRDCAIMLQATSGYDPLDLASVPVPVDDYVGFLEQSIKGLVMGIPSNYFFDPIDPEIKEAVSKAITLLEDLGVQLKEVEIKYVEFEPTFRKVGHSTILSREPGLRESPSDFSPPERYWLLSRQFVLARDLIKAWQLRRLFQQEWLKVMQQVDFLVTPTTPVLPWRFEATMVSVGDEEADVSSLPDPAIGWIMGRNTSPANQTGVPAISIPCGFSLSGLPIGLQILGRPWEESLILRVAHHYEQAAPSPKTVPPVVAQALSA